MASDPATTTPAPSVPHNREAEEATLGAILIGGNEIFHQVNLVLTAGALEFYIHRNQWLWDGMRELALSGKQIDLVTLSEQLQRDQTLGDIGGSAYITSLINQVPTSLNANAYAEIVHRHYVRREMIQAANEIAAIAYDDEKDITEATSLAMRELSMRVSTTAQGNLRSIGAIAKATDSMIEERGKSKILPGIQTGLMDLDDYLGGGMQPSDLLIVSTRPGGGKTSLLLQIAKHAARYRAYEQIFKHRVLIFSLEMPAEQLFMRLISQLSGIDFQLLRAGQIPDNQMPMYIQALDELASLDIVIDDTPAVTPEYIHSRCEVLVSDGGLDLVVIDYLNLINSGGGFSKKVEEVDYIARSLKRVARTFNVPVLLAHQQNRAQEKRGNTRPVMSDLNEGGDKDPDVIIFIWNVEDEDGVIESSKLVLAKHRNGPTGDVPVVFRKAYTRFEDAVIRKEFK